MPDYSVNFTVDGSMVIRAESADEAEREAIDILEGLPIMEAADNNIDGCTVRVSMEFTEDDDDSQCIGLERNPKCVEFA